MMNLAWLHLRRGDTQRARELFAEVVTLAASCGSKVEEAMGLAGQGFIAHLDGDVSLALRLVRRALMLAHEFGHRVFVGFFMDVLAVVAVGCAQVERAGRCSEPPRRCRKPSTCPTICLCIPPWVRFTIA